MAQEKGSENSPLSLSFSGSGFLSLYQLGAVKALRELAPEILQSAPRVYGASAGSLVAAAVVFQTNLDVAKVMLETAAEARKTILGPFYPKFNPLKNLLRSLQQLVPDNAHQLATGRLHIAVTRLSDLKNIIISDFNSKEEVVQVLLCSCFVPYYCGLVPPSFRGVRYIDGGCSNFHPFFSLKSILTVSPFTGEIDICPRDCPVSHFCIQISHASFQLSLENFGRLIHALFPPQTTILTQYYCQGYKDATCYLNQTDKMFKSPFKKTLKTTVRCRILKRHCVDILH
ncbi:omega-hydroxyceramide transacylase-like isoform X2 [Spea bombifrons]|uniref:omega-hydroxyceramide transacylase-like isoform X2 n=1 Tax=Spea bombifrons TaxID=233779 RepID=UPI00234B928B|nr:omega-hydroxyceramide transacylase-like isoform X2 [Spea bombifrons]